LTSIATNPITIIVAVAAVGTAAIVVTYSTDSDVTTKTIDPPVQYKAGDDAGPSNTGDYVTSYSISTSNTYITSTVKGVPEGDLTIDSFFKLENVESSSETVELSSSQVSNANVNDDTLEIQDSGDSKQATLDLTKSSPSASFTIGGSTTYHAALYLELASGTTPSDLNDGLSSKVTLKLK
jgi:hypothetical protein